MQFAQPWAFLLLALLPAALWFGLHKRALPGVRFSSTRSLRSSRPTLRQHLAVTPLVLRLIALCLVTVALARPQVGVEFVRDVTKGIAIEIVVDRSGSMAAEMSYDGERLTRLDVVKSVIEEFVNGGKGELGGRPNDLIGLVAFARYADTVSPLSLSHGAIKGFLDTVEIVNRQEEDGTSIGDAIALAAARLHRAGQDTGEDYEMKSKVIILLTDGQNNAGKRKPLEAASLADDWGIKIYTIGIGGGESFAAVSSFFGTHRVPI